MKKAGRVAQVLECLPSKHKAPSSLPVLTKEKITKNGWRRIRKVDRVTEGVNLIKVKVYAYMEISQ
jgi:hypothetical protein